MEKKFFWRWAIVTLSLIILAVPNHKVAAETYLDVNEEFDVIAASKIFDQLTKTVKKKKLSFDDYKDVVKELEFVRNNAKKCVRQAQDRIAVLDELIAVDVIQADPKTVDQQQDYKYVSEKRKFHAARRSKCQLLVLRLDETLKDYKDTIQSMSTTILLARDMPIWGFEPQILQALQDLHYTEIFKVSGLQAFSTIILTILAIILIIALGIGIRMRFGMQKLLNNMEKEKPIVVAFYLTLRHYCIPLSILTVLSLFMFVLFISVPLRPLVEVVCYTILLLTVFMASAHFLLLPPAPAHSPLNISEDFGKRLMRSVSFFALVVAFATIFFQGVDKGIAPKLLVDFAHVLFMSVSVFIASWFFWTLSKTEIMQQHSSVWTWLMKMSVLVLAAALLVLECIGYHTLTFFIISRVILTFLLMMGFVAVLLGLNQLTKLSQSFKYFLPQPLDYYLGLKTKEVFWEGFLLLYVVCAVLLSFLLVALCRFWGMPINFVDGLRDSFTEGFALAGLHLVPLNFAIGLAIFAIVNILGRIFSTNILIHSQRLQEELTQTTLSSVIRYFSFGLATVMALLILGTNFTSIAVILAPLMLGIGIGLQTVSNNFIAGIIILFEKPIKQGDRISVKGTEGFVRKIGIRSTRVATIDKTDIIIPNADLISNAVTNYMFRDKSIRLKCEVQVAYDSDIELVKSTLLKVASQQPEVIQKSPDQPKVFFRSFGDSSLDFMLSCIIPDQKKRLQTLSDLNAAIDQAFREQGIDMPFAQTDIHIKDWVGLKQKLD